MKKIEKEDALRYHEEGRPGKIQVVPTKPYATQTDLALAYSPGVAVPCLEIEQTPEDAYRYTAKGNLVAVISNGTAVLGLGNIGALAGKPVMEGKGLLFKTFADVDVFDIELDTEDVEKFIQTVKILAPTFGGINLEDIKAPECFEIERRLVEELDIPLMHDDQHGTAIISSAAMLNALEVAKKKINEIKIVVNGAGASAIACTKLYVSLGVKKENIIMCDSKGVIHSDRTGLTPEKLEFVSNTPKRTLAEAIEGADLFLGLSKANVLTQEMVRTMAENPIVFALANPDPEISYENAMASRPDIIFATGRSDHPNQVNNVLGFPFIFRGALDVRARKINEEMKKAAVKAIAALAKEPIPDSVSRAYREKSMSFGRHYLIPKALDYRLMETVSVAVAKAAVESGVARKTIEDWDAYAFELQQRMGRSNSLIRMVNAKTKEHEHRIVFTDGECLKVIQAAKSMMTYGPVKPTLLGSREKILQTAKENNIDLTGVEIIRFYGEENVESRNRYAQMLYDVKKRKGMTFAYALKQMSKVDRYALMMLKAKDTDQVVMSYSINYGKKLSYVTDLIDPAIKHNHIAGLYIMMGKRGPMFFADATVASSDEEGLVKTTLLVADAVRKYGIEPRIAMLSHSNYGVIQKGSPQKISRAVEILHTEYPDLLVEGEMQANFAFDGKLRKKKFPFNKLEDKDVNTFVFPCLNSGNIVSMFMKELSESEVVGPILLGFDKAISIVADESTVRDLTNVVQFTHFNTEE